MVMTRCVVVASVLLILGWVLVQRSAVRTESDVHTAPPPAVLAAVPDPWAQRDEVLLDLTIEPPPLTGPQEACALTWWWERHAQRIDLLEPFQRLYGAAHRPVVCRSAADRLMVRFPAHDRLTGGWAEFSLTGELLACAEGAQTPASAPMDPSVSATELETVSLACRRLAMVDEEVLIMMLWQPASGLAEDDWRQECGNWTLDARITDSTLTTAGGSSASGRHLAISIGEDGVLRDYSAFSWRACGSRRVAVSRSACKVRTTTEEPEPPLPVANN